MESELSKAVSILVEALKTDEGYREGWQANIAVQFQDAWERACKRSGLPCTHEQIHEISNEAAKNFLNLFIK